MVPQHRRWTNTQIDRQAAKQTDKQTDEQTNSCTDSNVNGQKNIRADFQERDYDLKD